MLKEREAEKIMAKWMAVLGFGGIVKRQILLKATKEVVVNYVHPHPEGTQQ